VHIELVADSEPLSCCLTSAHQLRPRGEAAASAVKERRGGRARKGPPAACAG